MMEYMARAFYPAEDLSTDRDAWVIGHCLTKGAIVIYLTGKVNEQMERAIDGFVRAVGDLLLPMWEEVVEAFSQIMDRFVEIFDRLGGLCAGMGLEPARVAARCRFCGSPARSIVRHVCQRCGGPARSWRPEFVRLL